MKNCLRLLLLAGVVTLGGCGGTGQSDTGVTTEGTSGDSAPAGVTQQESSSGSTPAQSMGKSSGSSAPSSAPATVSEFGVGYHYSGSCRVAWPTAPTVTSESIQMLMDCAGVPNKYSLVQVVYGDPTLNVTPSTGAMTVSGEVVDIAKNGNGMTLPVILADSIDIS